jgi:hypothetical protein
VIASKHTDRKRYVYVVVIVSLYGLLERLVDSLIEEFINCIAGTVASYESMPEAIRKHHINMSLELVRAISEERYRTSLTQEEVIANLHSCLSGAEKFYVNAAGFVLHRGNVSLRKITEFLSKIGVQNHLRRVWVTPELQGFFQKRDPEQDIRKVADQDLEALLNPIDSLVERRNEVSHGVINIDDIESTELLKERCHFVLAYGRALYNILFQESLKYQIMRKDVQALGKPIRVYDNSVVCFKLGDCRISGGDFIAADTKNTVEPFLYGPITSLQVNGKQLPDIQPTQPTEFGVKVSFRAKSKYEYYILPRDLI